MRACPAVAACLSLLLAGRVAVAAPAEALPEALFGQPIIDVQLVGPPWAQALRPALPAKPGMLLTRELIRGALVALTANAPDRLAQARVSGEAATIGWRTGVRLVFEVASVRHIEAAVLRDAGLPAAEKLVQTLLPRGAEFWPDVVQNVAEQIAAAYAHAGWRQAAVDWQATPEGDGLRVTLTVRRGAPTNLVEIEFLGDQGLPSADLHSAFSLEPGAQLSMDAIDDGIAELKARYREGRFYRAQVGLPIVKAADNLAVVEIPLAAGPRFILQVQGNPSIDGRTLLGWIHYAGDEVLDRATERDLAEKLRAYYEFAGFPDAAVEVRESPPVSPPPLPPERPSLRNDAPIGASPAGAVQSGIELPSTAPRVFVTFFVTEGEPQRVVDVQFTGHILKTYPVSDLKKRIELALKDAVPSELVNSRDRALLHAAGLSGSPGEIIHANPRVDPKEVFSRVGYENALGEIANLYKSKGYLDVQIGDPRLVKLGGGKLQVIIAIDAGVKSLVGSVRLEGVHQLDDGRVQRAITVHPGQPLSFFEIEQTRAAIIQLYQDEGYLSVNVDDQEPQPQDPSQCEVIFLVKEGVQVRVSSIEIKGATPEMEKVIPHAITLRVGGKVTPTAEQESVRNLMKLGLFTSASVVPAATNQPLTPLEVTVQERPAVSLDFYAGLSLVDGPRGTFNLTAPHFLGSVDTFNVNAKVDLPIFRFCWYGITGCPSTITKPRTRVEYNLSTGMGFPVFGIPGEAPPQQIVSLIAQNLLRPYYFLQSFSVLGTLNGLAHAHLGAADFNTVFQFGVEDDLFQQVNNATTGEVETFTDQRNLVLFPQGQTKLASFKPTFTIDARDNKLNPMSGVMVELAMDLSQSFGGNAGIFTTPAGEQNIPVSLLSTRLTVSGYIPIYRPDRVVFFLWGRGGYTDTKLFNQSGELIGSKAFFLGGTETLRGFSEDEVIPQDLRETYQRELAACAQTATGVGCTSDALSIRAGTPASNPGGSVVVAGRGELRFGITQSFDGALFFDTGNLWSDPTKVNLTQLRYSTGFGIRTPLPIGPAAIDLGFNLAPDYALGESLVQVHFAIGGG